MKKFLTLFLASLMCLSCVACGGNNKSVGAAQTKSLGETVSTDIAEFTLEDSALTYYVSNQSSNYVEPTETPNTLYAASVGHCYVSLTFTISNKDRGGSISYAGSFAEWSPNWTVSYNGKEYPVKGFDLNDNAGGHSINLSFSAIVDKETGNTIKKHDSNNFLLSAGETVTLRTFGIIDVEPESLNDGFEFTVGVLNSKQEYEYFTYTIPAQS